MIGLGGSFPGTYFPPSVVGVSPAPAAPPRISSTRTDALPPALHASFPRSRLQIGGPHQVWRLLRHKMEGPHLRPSVRPSVPRTVHCFDHTRKYVTRTTDAPSLSTDSRRRLNSLGIGSSLRLDPQRNLPDDTSPVRPLARSLHQRLGVGEREGELLAARARGLSDGEEQCRTRAAAAAVGGTRESAAGFAQSHKALKRSSGTGVR